MTVGPIMASAGISRSSSAGSSVAFEDYSLYSNLSDDELLQLAIERSLTETHRIASTDDSATAPTTTATTQTSRFQDNEPNQPNTNRYQRPKSSSQNLPAPQTSVQYSSPNPPIEKPPDLEEEPLFRAIREGNPSKVKALAMCPGTNLMLPSKPGWLAVHQAAWFGQDSCLRMLLSAQPGMVNKRTSCGETPLLVAVSRVQQGCVQVLLENGADPEIPNYEKETPLYRACERSNGAIVAALLNHKVGVNTRCIQGWTALQETVVRGNLEICEMLLKAGAKLNLRNMYGITPLFTAAQNGQLATLRFLIKHGADVNTQADDGATALYEAAKMGHEDVVQLLLSQKGDPNKPGKTGMLPLHIAAQRGSDAIVSMLIPVTSRPRVRRTGISPLHLAAERNRDDALEMLIDAGFDVNAQLSEERMRLYEDRRSTALYFSVINNNIEAVRMLLTAGADPNLDMFKPLMVASRMGCIQIVKLLVEHDADINAAIPTHPTTFPAVYMFSMKYLPLFKYLLDHGGHALPCFDCVYGNRPHPPLKTGQSNWNDDSDRILTEAPLRRGVQFCEMISVATISRWVGPIVDVLLDYVGHVTLCSRLMEHLDSYSGWSNIKEKAAPPRPLMQLCRLQILQLVGRRKLKKLPLPGGLIRFLKHQELSVDDES
ncbi:ankyrin repeat and SOCS box protein 2 isoform X3 [Girardinichthys multiradiatus]|uniref:ankyrin repeat and SOCS box protein 2 isoform X3 n=1 Tax=Girardinichthys multiradiatus TaxID=208333 RepID=UPI001FAD213B|nr:ankyrin repeat and SOCS box protein 2 isoform X3 [Girardinichthys multiradiatus]